MTAMVSVAQEGVHATVDAVTNHGPVGARPSNRGGRITYLTNLEVRMTLLVSNNTITAGEPLLARVALVNRSREAGHVSMGNSGGSTTCLEVLDSAGKLLAATPKRQIRSPDGNLSGLPRLGPGETYTQVWVVSGLYEFRLPGDYTIRVQQYDDSQLHFKSGSLILLSEDKAAVRVLPYDAARLKARCEELFLPLQNPMLDRKDVPMSARVKALYSVRDDIALPCLEWMAHQWHDDNACLAMRRIGTPKALGLVNDLAAREDSAGRAAKSALARELETKDPLWDVNWL